MFTDSLIVNRKVCQMSTFLGSESHHKVLTWLHFAVVRWVTILMLKYHYYLLWIDDGIKDAVDAAENGFNFLQYVT
jgi:hypothetical protein